MPANGEFLICPYNSSHELAAERFSFHLTRCLKSIEVNDPAHYKYIKKNMSHCRFYRSHVVSNDQLEEHEANCQYRSEVIAQKLERVNISQGCSARASKRLKKSIKFVVPLIVEFVFLVVCQVQQQSLVRSKMMKRKIGTQRWKRAARSGAGTPTTAERRS